MIFFPSHLRMNLKNMPVNLVRRLTRQDVKTLSLAALGGALEFYDFIIFVFFAAVIGDLFSLQISRSGCVSYKRSGFSPQVIWLARWAVS